MKTLVSIIVILLNINIVYAQWQKTNGPFNSNIKCLAQSGSTLFAVGETDGVFLSTNNGDNWVPMNNGLPAFTIYYSLVIDDSNLFLGTNTGVFISNDGGANWVIMNNGFPADTRVFSMFINGSDIYAGTTKGVFLLNDDGDNWIAENAGLPTGIAILSFAVSGSNLFIATNNGVFLSTDNGANWTEKNNGLPVGFGVRAIIAQGTNIYAGTSEGVYLSTDSGNSWIEKSEGLISTFGMVLFVDGTDIYAGTSAGLFISTNNGDSWASLKDGLSNLVYTNNNTAAILINGTDIFAGGSDGISISTDNGATWNYTNKGFPYTGVLTLATNGEAVYIGTHEGLFTITDNGNDWVRKFSTFTSSVKARDENIYIGSVSGNVYVSHDYGDTWIRSTGFSDNGEEVFAVAGTTVFAKYNVGFFSEGTGYISTDNGDSFTQEDLPYPIFANQDDNTLFAIDSTVFLYNGSTWTPVSSEINNDTVYSLAVNDSRFFVGTDGGVLTSTFNGTSWTRVNFGSADANVTSLAVNGSHVYACTSNNKIFTSSDNGITWNSATDNFIDIIIPKLPYGVRAAQLVINDTHIFVAAEQGIWTRPLSEITSVRTQATNSSVTIYPNPTSGRINIRGNDLSDLIIYNVLGEIMYDTSGLNVTSTALDLSAYPKGIYLVTFGSEGKRYTKKVLVQ